MRRFNRLAQSLAGPDNGSRALQFGAGNRWRCRAAALVAGTLLAGTHPDTAAQEANTGERQGQDEQEKAGREGQGRIDEILVTASRREEILQDAPLAVSVVDPAEFAMRGLKTLEDVVNYTPGVHYSDGGSPAFQTITMRGVSQTLQSPTVGMYLDDIPLGGGGQFAAAGELMPDLVKADLERIELIKGPQGTLYGASSMGGVIRYITKDPSLGEDLRGGFMVDISSMNHGSSSMLTRAWTSIPLVQDRVGISLSAFLNDLGGFIDRDITSVSGPADNVNSAQLRGGNAKLVGHITDRLTGTMTYLRSDTKFGGENAIELQGPPFEPVAGRFGSTQAERDASTSFQVIGGTLNYDLPWARLLSSTSYQNMKLNELGDLTAQLGPLIELIAGAEPGSVTTAPVTFDVGTERFVQEFRLSSDRLFKERLEWIAGAFFSREKSTNKQTLTGLPIDFTVLDVDLPSKQNQDAIFGNVTWYFTPKFDVTVGARLSSTRTSVVLTDSVEILIDSLPRTQEKTTDDTYMFNARYRPTENLSVYARVASGFRPGSAALPVFDETGEPAVPPIIKNDSLWSYEVGFKGALANRMIDYDFAIWRIRWSDPQANVSVLGVNTGGNANSDVRAYGAEGSLRFSPTSWLTSNSSFSCTNSVLKDDETAAFGGLAGERIPGIPRWTLAQDFDVSFPLNERWHAFFGAGVRVVGEQRTGFSGGEAKDGSTIEPLGIDFPLDRYTLVDVRAGLRRGNARLSFYGSNVLDEYAYSSAFVVPVVQGQFATARVVQPRTFGAILSVDF